MKRFATILLALVMILSLAVPAFAAGTGSITINPPKDTAADATNTYKIYKVFDADGNGTNISYKLVEGKTKAPEGFSVDEAGNVTCDVEELTPAIIEAIGEYVKNDEPIATVTATGSNSVVAENLPNGYYYITTTLGTVVTIDSTNPNATVEDKNTAPKLDKKITDASSFDADGKKALAQVGTNVTFTVTITVGKGAVNYVFHDTMSAGLSYNNDVAVSGINAEQYTVKETPDAGDTITITFVDGIAEGTEITITYSAKVTSDALQEKPAVNTAWLEYGKDPDDEDEPGYETPKDEVEVYNAKFTVTKQNGNKEPLAGAGFVIKNADDKYYKLENGVVSWVDSIDDATEYKSDAEGNVPAFTGLANGTYTLVEKTVPAGYNKALDSTFTIAEHDYEADNLIQDATVINNSGSELPSTGGMGTTMFYLFGGIMVLAAVVLLVTKKRMSNVQ